jgi:hypothetical protein
MPTSSQSRSVFAAEHASLNEILMGTMACTDLPQIIDCFDRLEPVLTTHIEGEESPRGMLSLLTRARVMPEAVFRIKHDHQRFLVSVSQLRHEARAMLTDDLCGDHLPKELQAMRARVMGFTEAVLTHEKYETQVFMSVLDLRAR